jgi:crossover junction endodeoxyribonuclease RuvC
LFCSTREPTSASKNFFVHRKNREGPARVRYCGIDPGLSGAVAFIRPDAAHPANRLAVFDAPLVGGEFDGVAFAKLLAERLPDLVAIEHAFSRPGQGVASTFKFGKTFGQALGVIQAMGIPYELVSPTVWKKHFKISANSPKDASRLVCRRLYPGADIPLKRHHGRADAILIAHYTWQRLNTAKKFETEVLCEV